MSIGSLGVLGSLAATPLPQKAADADKVQRDATDQSRSTQTEIAAEAAAGIGETEEDSQAAERDADGRRLWEAPPKKQAEDAIPSADPAQQLSKDPSGDAGGELDLVG
jgi:hypothetical protein